MAKQNVNITLRIHYKGDRARWFNTRINDTNSTLDYFSLFVKNDIQNLGLPDPHSTSPVWRSGIVICHWKLQRDSELHNVIKLAYQAAVGSKEALLEPKLIATLSLSEEHKATKSANLLIQQSSSASGASTPSVQASSSREVGKAPVVPKFISLARKAASPLVRPASQNAPLRRPGSPKIRRLSSQTLQRLDLTQQTLRRLSKSMDPQAEISHVENMVPPQPSAVPPPLPQPTLQPHLLPPTLPPPILPPTCQPPLLQRVPQPPPLLQSAFQPLRIQPFPQLPPLFQSSFQPPCLQPVLQPPHLLQSASQSHLQPQPLHHLPPGLQPPSSRPTFQPSSLQPPLPPPIPPVILRPRIRRPSVPSKISPPESSTLVLPTSVPPASANPAPAAPPTSAPPASAAHTPTPSATSSSSSMSSEDPQSTANTVTRELWGVRRELAALKARENALARKLKQLRAPMVPEPPFVPQEEREGTKLEDELIALRAQLEKESRARHAAETALQDERKRRVQAEGVVDDARRECTKPFVVPALVDAFMKLAELTGDVIVEAELDYGAQTSSGW